ncbi:MAG: type III pantothenate kinase [Deltaproteobacteria bacterium]
MTLLCVDIGNTSTTFGLFPVRQGLLPPRPVKRFAIPTARYNFASLKKSLGKHWPDAVIVSSVVPKATDKLKKDCVRYFGIKPQILGRDTIVPIKNSYRRPEQVGQDRLVNAFAGVLIYGAPLIVIDFGTAVTFDCISRKREYLGGMILPGLGISLDALHRRTALLPSVKLAPPRELIGKETTTSILSGVIYGMAALTDDLSDRIKKEIGASAKVIGTGGNINLISRYSRSLDAVDPDLTLKGLYLIHTSCGRD